MAVFLLATVPMFGQMVSSHAPSVSGEASQHNLSAPAVR